MTQILGETDQITPPAEVLQTLVGEGKKFKDVESLARGKLESDAFIAKLQEENQNMRTEMEKNMNFEQQLAALAAGNTGTTTGTPPVEQGNQPLPTGRTPEDVEALLDRKLGEREANNIKQANIRQVDEYLLKHFGGDANKAKDAVAALNASLGINLTELAATSPQAVTRLIGGNSPQGYGMPAERGTVRTVNIDGTVRNRSYYEVLRKEQGNSKFYADRKLQVQIHKDAQALGDAFYS